MTNSSSPSPTAAEIRSLPYVELLAMLGESNLPPGGFDSIHRLIGSCHLGPHSRVLHAGCNAGFLTRELARLSGATVTGIDISPAMAEAAARRAEEEGLAARVRHQCMDMRQTGFAAASFDVTLSGGALAFVVEQPRAVSEWIRVTRPFGILADAELYYDRPPPDRLRQEVARLIGVPVPCYTRRAWEDLFRRPELVGYVQHDAPASHRSDEEVKAYCRRMVALRAGQWAPEAREVLYRRLEECFLIFNENLAHMRYLVMSFRRLPDDAEPLLYH
jgi:SAM-dependent methyltransferase